MKVTYIEHSCFLVETETKYFLFDYYKGKIPTMDNKKPIYVFSSHNHHDHFNFEIFRLLNGYYDIHYILSNDIKRKFGRKVFAQKGVDENLYKSILFLSAGVKCKIDNFSVETLKSTDEGVAFIIETDGKAIYHAGDLNQWIWQGESEEFNSDMTKHFKKEIEKISGRHFDIAFLVLDPRQGNWFYKGFDYFMNNTDTAMAYPMHFWGDADVIDSLLTHSCSKEYRDKIIKTN